MRYSDITTCDICNGVGLGVVLWCSGCSLQCPNCHNQELQDSCKGKLFDRHAYQKICDELSKPYITRLTLSGGHPLEPYNIDACTKLCCEVKNLFPHINIWLYTGFKWEDIKNEKIFNYVDVVVDGPYIDESRDITLPFRGSSNQRIIDVQKSLREKEVCIYDLNK